MKFAILEIPSICENIDLLIGIKSLPSNIHHRRTIRRTWGNFVNYKNFNAKLIFILGGEIGFSPNAYLKNEIENYHDVLLGDFVEHFHNLTFKDAMLMTWARQGVQNLES